MSNQITLEEALKLVRFYHSDDCGWQVLNVFGTVRGHVCGDVGGTVDGTINGREWTFVETPKNKLQRLITESGNQELIDTFNQMQDN